MNPVIRTRWADALRSGDYGQTNQALHDSEGHCCLGVLCDIYAQDMGTEWHHYQVDSFKLRLTGLEQEDYLPKEVVDWAEFSDDEVRRANGGSYEGYDVTFPVPDKYKGKHKVTMPDHSFAASTINDNCCEERACNGNPDAFGSFDDIADLVDTMKGGDNE